MLLIHFYIIDPAIKSELEKSKVSYPRLGNESMSFKFVIKLRLNNCTRKINQGKERTTRRPILERKKVA